MSEDANKKMRETVEARESFRRALTLTQQQPEWQFLERRLAELKN